MPQRILVVPMLLCLLFTTACDNSTGDADKEQQKPRPPDGPTHTCTLMACSSGYTLRVPLTVSFEVLRKSTVSACLNALCYTSSLATLTEPRSPETSSSISLLDPSQHDPQHTPLVNLLATRSASGGYMLELSYDTWTSSSGAHPGDVYDVTLTDEHGTKLVDAHDTLPYTLHQPNGPSCGPTCLRATIDKT